ncbi:sensor domain-containing protein [Streptomyces sp. SID13031]|uniref:sensor histidine kinase n=1 Tax=Streptomyces sp. SID13031 TaxID=2706046 RepID=UPI0013C9022A|nr:sensor domain-containing protein [Streptomyces sp. SID13031]NEA36845.1 sensor histidine kinase [Streptomyces sp. SID13031]
MSIEKSGKGPRRGFLLSRLGLGVDALEHLVGGLGTALLALAAVVWVMIVALSCLIGIGFLLIPSALQVTRAIADRERARLTRWGPEVVGAEPLPDGRWEAVRNPSVRRELGWLLLHATFGFLIGLLGLTLPLYAVQSLTFPLWYGLLPPGTNGPGLAAWRIDGLADALVVGLTGIAWFVIAVAVNPVLARVQAWTGRRLLSPSAEVDLSLRVSQLTSTRAAALDAHAVELRRIERSLHDGAQNRLVAVTVFVGAARRALTRDPATAEVALAHAQDAAEQALAELRMVARGILPPVLEDRGLAGALTSLVSSCGVPCDLDIDVSTRCAASVEATAYFVVAEALTNITRHSGATGAAVVLRQESNKLQLRIEDDGRGGADPEMGSGLTGIRRRVEAFDGRLTLTSPAGGPTIIEVELPCG